MLHLLFTLVFFEMAVILLLVFRNPLRKLVIMCLDRFKRGRGSIVIKTLAATVLVMLTSSLYSMFEIRHRGTDEEVGGVPLAMNPTDQVLMARHLLEATLMGASLFLALMIDRLHHYIRELRIRRKSMEAVKKQGRSFEEGKIEENKALEVEIAELQSKLKSLDNDLQASSEEKHASEVNSVALSKQFEGLLLEYDRLQEENEKMRNQLQSLDSSLSRSDTKKTA